MITTNDIEQAKQDCFNIYLDYQAVLAGQSNELEECLQDDFEEKCAEFGLNVEETWEWCEDQHSASYGL